MRSVAASRWPVAGMGNVQVWAKGPNVGKYEIRDFEARGNVIRIPVNGDFRKALDDWLNSNATDIEVPIQIDIWYGDTHIGFAAAHYVPREVGNMERGEYVIKAAVYIIEKPIKKVNNTAARLAPGLDCNYEWRYNTTLIDTRRITLFLLYNQYNYSGLVSVLGFITHVGLHLLQQDAVGVDSHRHLLAGLLARRNLPDIVRYLIYLKAGHGGVGIGRGRGRGSTPRRASAPSPRTRRSAPLA